MRTIAEVRIQGKEDIETKRIPQMHLLMMIIIYGFQNPQRNVEESV
jgi:hypothetical protein